MLPCFNNSQLGNTADKKKKKYVSGIGVKDTGFYILLTYIVDIFQKLSEGFTFSTKTLYQETI